MPLMQRVFERVGAQLKALTPSARLLIGSLMIIIVLGLFLVSLYAGSPSMAPLGLGGLSEDAKLRAVNLLETRGVQFEDRGSDVYVPVDQKYRVLATLSENGAITADQINFETLMQDDSPFRSREQNRQRYLVAKMNVLAGMVSQMSGIERATVVIDQADGPTGLGSARIAPSASVTVRTTGGELNAAMVDAIAALVAGSHAGLKPANVAVLDARTGRTLAARSADSVTAGQYLELKLAHESHARRTLESALAYIPGVTIAVNAQVDPRRVLKDQVAYDEPKLGVTDERTREQTSTNQSGPSEPGVRSNTRASVESPTRTGSSTSDTTNETSTQPAFGTTNSTIHDPKGYAVQINATVGVPKSYFVRLFQDQAGDATAQPDQAALDQLVTQETSRIKADLQPLIDTAALEGASAGLVAVSMVPDFGMVVMPTAGGAEALAAGGTGSMGGLLSDGLVKTVSLGALALVSLVMMFLMVRRAGARDELPTAAELVGIPPALTAAESDLVGEADEAAPALEGVEITDDALRRHQMLDQIKDMVNSSPDEAAGLMRRWMRTGE